MQKELTADERHLSAIAGLQRQYDAALAQWEEAKAEAKAKKEVAAQHAAKLHEYVRALNQPLPLFEVWRQTPVQELDLPDGVTALLAEHGLDTVGKLADWTNSGKALTDIPHVGEAKAEAIRQALEVFWRDHPRPADGEVGE